MTPNMNRRGAFLMLVTLVLSVGIVATTYFTHISGSATSDQGLGVAHVPSLASLPQDPPTPGPVAPYPRKPGEPQTGDVPTPTPFKEYSVPPMTAVPVGSDTNFDVNPTPAVGYTPPPTPLPSDPVNGSAIADDILDPGGKTHISTNVISGTVAQIEPARYSTLDGTRPANPRAPNSTTVIFRPVIVTVNSYLKGSGANSVMVMAIGGTIGQDSVSFGDSRYTFNVGEQVILFLTATGIDPNLRVDGYSPWVSLAHWTITADQASNQATDGNQTMPLQQLLDMIAAARR